MSQIRSKPSASRPKHPTDSHSTQGRGTLRSRGSDTTSQASHTTARTRLQNAPRQTSSTSSHGPSGTSSRSAPRQRTAPTTKKTTNLRQTSNSRSQPKTSTSQLTRRFPVASIDPGRTYNNLSQTRLVPLRQTSSSDQMGIEEFYNEPTMYYVTPSSAAPAPSNAEFLDQLNQTQRNFSLISFDNIKTSVASAFDTSKNFLSNIIKIAFSPAEKKPDPQPSSEEQSTIRPIQQHERQFSADSGSVIKRTPSPSPGAQPIQQQGSNQSSIAQNLQNMAKIAQGLGSISNSQQQQDALNAGAKALVGAAGIVSQGSGPIVAWKNKLLGALVPYFSVNIRYVLKKLYLITFPFAHKNWRRTLIVLDPNQQRQNVEAAPGADPFQQQPPQQPILAPKAMALPPSADHNTPDLYIPAMGLFTFALVIATMYGLLYDRFNPEIIVSVVRSCFVLLILETFIESRVLYAMLPKLAKWVSESEAQNAQDEREQAAQYERDNVDIIEFNPSQVVDMADDNTFQTIHNRNNPDLVPRDQSRSPALSGQRHDEQQGSGMIEDNQTRGVSPDPTSQLFDDNIEKTSQGSQGDFGSQMLEDEPAVPFAPLLQIELFCDIGVKYVGLSLAILLKTLFGSVISVISLIYFGLCDLYVVYQQLLSCIYTPNIENDIRLSTPIKCAKGVPKPLHYISVLISALQLIFMFGVYFWWCTPSEPKYIEVY